MAIRDLAVYREMVLPRFNILGLAYEVPSGIEFPNTTSVMADISYTSRPGIIK